MTRAGLGKRAFEACETLAEVIDEREAGRPANDTLVMDHEYYDRRGTLHNEETQRIYARDYPEIADLREQVAKRGRTVPGRNG